MSIFTFFQLFASAWCSTILFFFKGLITYKQLALVLAIVATLIILFYFIKCRFKVNSSMVKSLIAVFLLIFLYSITPIFYMNTTNARYDSFLLVLVGQFAPAVICANIVACDDSKIIRIKGLTPIVGFVFTIISLISTLNPTSQVSAGYMDNDNGLNYQSASYMAAYASSLMEFYFLTKDKEFHFSFLKRIGPPIAVISILVNLFTVLLSGGRGGFVLYIISIFVFVVLMVKSKAITIFALFKRIIAFLLFCLGVLLVYSLVSNTTISTSGFRRIIDFISGGGDSLRVKKMIEALHIFMSKPLIGHGFGSVFYEMGQYSHNIISDILLEGGLIGLLAFIVLQVAFFIQVNKLIKDDITNSLWLFIFLCGFIMSFFSGYFIAHIPMYWSISFIFAYYKKDLANKSIIDVNEDLNLEEDVKDVEQI